MVAEVAVLPVVLIISMVLIVFPVCAIVAPGLIPLTIAGLIVGLVVALVACFILSR